MLRRAQPLNIPTDILRTVTVVVDLGSFTKAGERLGLTQPAISSQMKRLQVLVGGPIFEKGAGGVTLNERGKIVMAHTRRLLEINDQILALGGAAQDPRPIRVGLSDYYADRFLQSYRPDRHGEISISCDHSNELQKGLVDGYLDVACLLKPNDEIGEKRTTWREPLVWVRSRHFVISPGAPLPLVGWPGLLADQTATTTLESRGLAYRLAFQSCDRHNRIAAVQAGLGIMLLPEWLKPEQLVVAREHYLPSVAPVEAGVIIRRGFQHDQLGPLVDLLAGLQHQPEPRRQPDQDLSNDIGALAARSSSAMQQPRGGV